MPLIEKPFPIQFPAEVMDADARFHNCLQNSASLAYACLTIRRGNFALAEHLIEVFEQKSAPFSEIAVYLKIWNELESGHFGKAKSELLALLFRQPADSLSLSLLQACIIMELEGKPVVKVEKEIIAPVLVPKMDPGEPESTPDHGNIPESEISHYQLVVSDPQTQAFGLWNIYGGLRCAKRPGLQPLPEAIPYKLPHELAASMASLELGMIQKITFMYAGITVTTWHSPILQGGLVSGPLPKALLTIVRAEKTFLKRLVEIQASSDILEAKNGQ